MTPRKKVPFFTKLDPELREALRRYKADVGVPEAEQIHRALTEWLAERPEAWPRPSARRKPRPPRNLRRKKGDA